MQVNEQPVWVNKRQRKEEIKMVGLAAKGIGRRPDAGSYRWRQEKTQVVLRNTCVSASRVETIRQN